MNIFFYKNVYDEIIDQSKFSMIVKLIDGYLETILRSFYVDD